MNININKNLIISGICFLNTYIILKINKIDIYKLLLN